MKHDEGQFSASDGLKLYYQCWRPEETAVRSAIVMLHGDFGHSGYCMNLPLHEAPRGYAVYAYDRRGWGRSPGPRGYVNKWRENLEDLDEFLKLVRADEASRPIFLMGHSGSAVIVLEYAAQHPQALSGVFCISPALNMAAAAPPPLHLLLHLLSGVWPRLSIDIRRQFDAQATYVSHDPGFVELIRHDPFGNTKVTPRWMVESDAAMQRVVQQAPDLRVPVMILIGGADKVTGTDAAKAYYQKIVFPDKEFHQYPGDYTNLLSELNTEEVLNDIDNWLDKH